MVCVCVCLFMYGCISLCIIEENVVGVVLGYVFIYNMIFKFDLCVLRYFYNLFWNMEKNRLW